MLLLILKFILFRSNLNSVTNHKSLIKEIFHEKIIKMNYYWKHKNRHFSCNKLIDPEAINRSLFFISARKKSLLKCNNRWKNNKLMKSLQILIFQ